MSHRPGRAARRRATGVLAAMLVAATGLPAHAAAAAAAPGECGTDRTCLTARELDQVRSDPARLQEFLSEFPKGGDLHNHLSGAIATESLIGYAAEDGRCIDTATLAASPGPCRTGQRPASDAVSDPQFRDQVLRAWSMEGFDPSGPESGHDHFFATFGKFGAATEGRTGDMLAGITRDAARDHLSYVETMYGLQGSARWDLVQRVGFPPHHEQDFAELRRRLLPGMREIAAAAQRDNDAAFARRRDLLHCGSAAAEPACGVRLAHNFQVGREAPPEQVFGSLLLGFELAQRDSRTVGLNMVQPEDGEISLRDYTLQMRMVGFLRHLYPQVHVTLHAGELVPGLVKPEDLSFHIREAVDIAEVDRVGHAVDLEHETGWQALAERMRRRGVLVESPLTSNCQILRACGPGEHPLPTYLRHGVPVALATDDPGVSRSSITADYRHAVESFGLTYPQLVDSARESLEHAFLPGPSLWAGSVGEGLALPCAGEAPGARPPSTACEAYLEHSPKAATQWDHEAALQHFESTHTTRS